VNLSAKFESIMLSKRQAVSSAVARFHLWS